MEPLQEGDLCTSSSPNGNDMEQKDLDKFFTDLHNDVQRAQHSARFAQRATGIVPKPIYKKARAYVLRTLYGQEIEHASQTTSFMKHPLRDMGVPFDSQSSFFASMTKEGVIQSGFVFGMDDYFLTEKGKAEGKRLSESHERA